MRGLMIGYEGGETIALVSLFFLLLEETGVSGNTNSSGTSNCQTSNISSIWYNSPF